EGRQRMLQLELERAALTVPGDDADRNERKKEGSGELAGAEGRRPDADERRERFADADGGPVEAAEIGVGANGADEGDADERSHRGEKDPPRARGDALAPFLGEEPEPGGAR